MALIDFFVKNPAKVTVGVLLMVLFGFVALRQMPMQLTPEVQTPTITIETRWPGASPQEVEQQIVIEQEEQLKGVEGVRKLTSESLDSMGRIILEFNVGTNMDQSIVDVIGRLEQVPEYPEDADKPVISTSNANDRPIAWFILSGRYPTDEELAAFQQEHPQLRQQIARVRRSHNAGLAMMRLRELAADHPEVAALLPPPELDVPKLRRFAEDEIEARFERVPGVSNSNVLGGLEDELQVVVDPQKLAARRLTIADVRNVLRGQNKDTSGGDYWEGKRRYVVRTLGQFKSPQQVEAQLLAIRDGSPVYIRDVAEVRLDYKKPDGLVRRFGESSIAVNCLRETGANVIDVIDGLKGITDELNETILKQRGLQLTQVYDESGYINSAVDLVQQNIFMGGALTMVVLMSFLHLGMRTLLVAPVVLLTALAAAYLSPWYFAVTLLLIIGAGFWFARGALVVGLAIPTSIIGTFLILGMLGRSLNVISLAGLAFAVGMLVDNAVVVLENVFRRWDKGEPPFTAAVRGTMEVGGAVLSSTLTTVAVFLPIVFVEEEAGQLFRDIAMAISAAVSLSLLISMTLIPMASARLFTTRSDEQAPTRSPGRLMRIVTWPVRMIERFGSAFVTMVVKFNAWIQRGLVRQIAVVVTLVGAAIGLSYTFWPQVEYLPTGNRNLVFGILLPPPGYNLDMMMEMGETVEAALAPYWNVDPGSPEAAQLDYPIIGDFFFVARGRSVFLGIRAYEAERVGELVPLVQQVGMQLPGTFAVAKQSSLFEQGLTAGRTVDIEITGPSLEKLVGLGGRILGQIKNPETGVIPDAQVRPVPSLDLSSPELHVVPKLVQAAEMGVSSTDLGYTVNALIDGAYASDYYLEGDKIDLTIIGSGLASGDSASAYGGSSQSVRALPVATPIGELVPLSALADVTLSSGPEQINHRERTRAITIEVSPPAEMPLEEAMTRISSQIVQPLVDSGELDGGYRITLAGTADKLRDTWESLQFNLGLALLITYLLMVALFESWLYPFVIILSVPLGAVGGILGLWVLNLFLFQSLDVLTMLGFVILIGTVVNNPILIIHQSLNHMREDGMLPREAILESVHSRIRPIFMTTTTTVLGLLPLVLFPGAGSELYRGLGSVVLGGLLVSTIFTLVLVPTLFTLMMSAKDVMLRLLGRRGPATGTPAPASRPAPSAEPAASPAPAPSPPPAPASPSQPVSSK
jgi:hydrophobic/amphiphilic exporter-1 (mainly G- bacteria), HAE1 family